MDEKHKYQNFITEIPSTAVDIYRMLPEGTRCEVIFNELSMSPSPSREHQKLLIKLTSLLFEYLTSNPIAELFTAPFDVYFEKQKSVVQPDLFVVLNDQMDIVEKNGVHGVPRLIIEIVSTNRAYDTQKKRSLYESAGVKEYFIIDPENNKVILLTLGVTGLYEQTYEETGVLKSAILSCRISF
ncbi:Uma2 family endonuclease [Mucilaginibacter sp. OK283]|jgi:Uma2 family endonuclease|uniref:Uma2 family endonuclease n=1 Tax=Mucilaginibacter sp. OK283 TaxID=1881049 RepID=UPI0008B40E96|nr:Uma2 family endonuclease [Mucilaginibacter sp. OK283]SEP45125.1 Putative restriction endonuclease [Mucilaginibacter sp. OK283]